MEIDAALSADLELLSRTLDATDIGATLRRLIGDVRAAVDSYLGLTIRMIGSTTAFTVTSTEQDATSPGAAASSVLITITAGTGEHAAPLATVTLYASRPGAFVDLVADLAWLTGLSAGSFRLDQHLRVPGHGAEVGARPSVHVMSVVDQALGMLIGHGYPPEQAAVELDTRAAAAGTDRYGAALGVLAAHTGPW